MRELRRILPESHPFFEKIKTELPEESEEEEHDPNQGYTLGLLIAVVDTIDDWKRGIREWAEVESTLGAARAEIPDPKEAT